MHGNAIDLVGRRVDRLVVLSLVAEKPKRMWLCRCDCGGTRIIDAGKLRLDKRCRSLGCTACRQDRINDGSTKHGGCKGGVSKLWNIWYSMRNRCRNPRNPGFKYYGGKGVTVCQEWQEFAPFQDWMLANGYQPGLSIDRIDSARGYSPENCRVMDTATNRSNGIAIANENKRRRRSERLATA